MKTFEQRLDEALSGLNVAYRVILDEPIGIAIGFKPTQIKFQGVIYPTSLDIEQFVLEADDGGNAVFISDDSKTLVVHGNWSGMKPPPPPSQLYKYPEPMDLEIWRSQKEFINWVRDYYGI